MGKEIDKLNKETAALSKDLQSAKSKLAEKELALGRERLAAADKELQLNRVINSLKTKVQQADLRLADLNKLQTIVSESPAPIPTPAAPAPKVRSVTDSAPILDVVKAMEMENSKKRAEAMKNTATKGETKTVAAVETVKEEKKTVAKKKSVKGVSKPPAKSVKGASKPAAKNKAAAKKKIATKKTAAAKKTVNAKKEEGDSWSTLSESTLSRKTVQQLIDYLSTKGVPTTDEDGKPLKKALLVEAIQAA